MFEGISKKEFIEAAAGAVCTAIIVYLMAVGFLVLFWLKNTCHSSEKNTFSLDLAIVKDVGYEALKRQIIQSDLLTSARIDFINRAKSAC